jgi:hypothetical protein
MEDKEGIKRRREKKGEGEGASGEDGIRNVIKRRKIIAKGNRRTSKGRTERKKQE